MRSLRRSPRSGCRSPWLARSRPALATALGLALLGGGDAAAASEIGRARREIAVTGRYLHLPVRNGAPLKRMRVAVGETVVDEFDIELAPDEADFAVSRPRGTPGPDRDGRGRPLAARA